MRISGLTSTELFRGTPARPLQVVRVRLVNDGPAADPQEPVTVRVDGAGVSTPEPEVLTGCSKRRLRTSRLAGAEHAAV